MNKTGIIILAAGNSSRMGETKQLMKYKNKNFVQHVVDEAIAAGLDPVICVMGYQASHIAESISGTGVTFVYNERWPEGMGSGIAAGVQRASFSDADALILAVSDQPHVSADLFVTMETMKKSSGKGIIAASYAGTLGTPVLFTKKYFEELSLLNGNQGAKKIAIRNMPDVCTVDFEMGNIDIDTKEDYENLISEK